MAPLALLLLASSALVTAIQVTSPVRLAEDLTVPGETRQILQNRDDVAYYAEVTVGSQKLKAIVDTGSFELLVFGKNCTVCGHTLYDHSLSKAAKVTSIDTHHEYGSGTTYSVLAYDQFSVAGLTAPTQQFWEVTDANMYILAEGSFQAIFGVGPPASAVKFAEDARAEVDTELEQMKKAGSEISAKSLQTVRHYHDMVDLQKKTIGVIQGLGVDSISFCFGSRSGSDGYIYWNDHAALVEPEKFLTLKVIGDLYWSAEMGAVKLEHGSAPDDASPEQQRELSAPLDVGCTDGNCSAVLDTGTSLITAPSETVAAVWSLASEWEEAGGTCDDLSKLPVLTFTLNGRHFSLPPESYMGLSTGGVSSALQKYMPHLHRKQQKLRRQWLQRRRAQVNRTLTSDNSDPLDWDDDSGFGSYSEGPMCSPLIMNMDANSQFGQLWILGMPFFRTYYTTFNFKDGVRNRPQAASISLSVADHDCKPGVVPGVANNPQLIANLPRPSEARRPATLRVDVSKLRVPTLSKRRFSDALRRGYVERSSDRASGDVPFYRI